MTSYDGHMDAVLFVVSEFTPCEGGHVIGAAMSVDVARTVAERLHDEPLGWKEPGTANASDGLVLSADVPGSEIREYHIERFEIR